MYFDENNNYFTKDSKREFEIENNIYNTSINIDNISLSKRCGEIFCPEEGFMKGNMFEDLYRPYKNHTYKIRVNNRQDSMLCQIQMYNFAIRDLGLYLDLYPNDKALLNEFLCLNKKLTHLKGEYEKEFSPIEMNDVTSKNKYNWVDNPWPWDKGGI